MISNLLILLSLSFSQLLTTTVAIKAGKPFQSQSSAFIVQPRPKAAIPSSSSNQQLHPSKKLQRHQQKLFFNPYTAIQTLPPFSTILQAKNDNDEDDEVPIWQTKGEEIIRNAAIEAGALPDQISIAWKPSRVIVTISGGGSEKDAATDDDDAGVATNLVISTNNDDDDNDVEIDDLEDINADLEGEAEEQIMEQVKKEEPKGLDLTAIARSINAALDDEEGSVGWYVAFHHEIEVTTPGTSDVLQGKVMFDAYRGFDVIMEGVNEKNGKKKVVEGKLVERDDKVTKVNVKGRTVKMKNENVVCVRLPKAKKEKGVR